MPRVILKNWRPGLRKVSLNKLLQDRAGMSLTAAKAAVDQLLDGRPVRIELGSPDKAATLAREAAALGAECEVE